MFLDKACNGKGGKSRELWEALPILNLRRIFTVHQLEVLKYKNKQAWGGESHSYFWSQWTTLILIFSI